MNYVTNMWLSVTPVVPNLIGSTHFGGLTFMTHPVQALESLLNTNELNQVCLIRKSLSGVGKP